MSWKDSDSFDDAFGGKAGRPGGDWRGIRPSLDNPMTWAVSLGRWWDISVRIHALFLLIIVIQLVMSLGPPAKGDVNPLGFGPAIMRMGGLFLIVLLHEFGHCIACRRVGGVADEILMWPLGGLAYCQPPNAWKAHLITVLGGPLVNVVIFLILCPTLIALTGNVWGVGIPSPLYWPAWSDLQSPVNPWILYVLVAVHQMSFLLLLFNLLPVFPLDGGRIVQALLWQKLGYVRSMRWAVRIGYFGAIGLGMTGIITRQWMLLGIAFFGGITCYLTHKQLEFTQSMMGFEHDDYALQAYESENDPPTHSKRQEKREAKKDAKQKADEAELDRILEKIASTGMDSLNRREKHLLSRASARKQSEK